MQSVLIKLILSMGVKKSITLLLKLAHILCQKTKSQKDDEIIDALIQMWQVIGQNVPNTVKTGLKR